jgi:hypothetical protein
MTKDWSRRTKIAKGALLFFSEKTGVHSCTVRDVTNRGAGIRAENLKIVPVNFALSFDNFPSVHMCRLIWLQGEFLRPGVRKLRHGVLGRDLTAAREAPSAQSSAGFCSECEYHQHGCRRKDQWYAIHNHGRTYSCSALTARSQQSLCCEQAQQDRP